MSVERRAAAAKIDRRGRRAWLACAVLLLALTCPVAGAQTAYPNKPIRLLVGYPPGGATDIVARIVAQKLGERLGQPVVVDNLPGAGGIIASEKVAKAAPDGYTLVLTNTAHGINPSLHTSLPYDTVASFAPVIKLADLTLVLVVTPTFPARSVGELVALARSRPGALHFASSGVGQSLHLAGELLKSMAGIDIVHVPYKGGAPARAALLAGQVEMMFESAIGVLPFVQAGRLRALGVSGAQRSPAMPDVPTLAEAGVPGFEASGWLGILAPAGTPAAIVAGLNADVNAVLRQADVSAQLAGNGADVAGGSPEQFAAFVAAEIEKWARVVKATGLKAE
jgi:tripartite-type tricarboxylate transporter receptor subunit TctC